MRALAVLFVLTGIAACQSKTASTSEESKDKTPAPSAEAPSFAADMENLCHAEERSGALELGESDRAVHVAQWLGNTMKTDEARKFLAGLASLKPEGKHELLRKTAAEHGVKDCPIANAWGGPRSPAQP